MTLLALLAAEESAKPVSRLGGAWFYLLLVALAFVALWVMYRITNKPKPQAQGGPVDPPPLDD